MSRSMEIDNHTDINSLLDFESPENTTIELVWKKKVTQKQFTEKFKHSFKVLSNQVSFGQLSFTTNTYLHSSVIKFLFKQLDKVVLLQYNIKLKMT